MRIGGAARCLYLRPVHRGGRLRRLGDDSAPAETRARPRLRARTGRRAQRATRRRSGRSSRRIGRRSRYSSTTGSGRRANSRTPRTPTTASDVEDFAKQMTMIAPRGLRDGRPQTFIDFVQGEAGRPSPAAAAAHVRRRPRGLVDRRRRHPRRARLQRGHVRRRRPRRGRRPRVPHLGRAPDRAGQRPLAAPAPLRRRATSRSSTARGPDDYGPYYAYEKQGEDFDEWQERVRSDIEWGEETLADHDLPLTSRSRSLRRTAATARTARTTPHPRRAARLAHAALRRDLHAGRERAGTPGQRTSRSAGSRSRGATTGGDLHEMLLSGEQG